MKYRFINKGNGAELSFFFEENAIFKRFTEKRQMSRNFMVLLNLGPEQKIVIDAKDYNFSSGSILPLFDNQAFDLKQAKGIIAWQYNTEFCNGLVVEEFNKEMFPSALENIPLAIDPVNHKKINSITQMFINEFSAAIEPEREMLEILMRQLIVIIFRIAKNQQLNGHHCIEERLELIKKYNIIVEKYYKKEHQVQFYAEKLNRSPKTLSNLFLLYRYRSPLLVIHQRIIKEAKKLFYYTEMSAKEIAFELGFQEQAHFSRFFKNYTSYSPTDYKKKYLNSQ